MLQNFLSGLRTVSSDRSSSRLDSPENWIPSKTRSYDPIDPLGPRGTFSGTGSRALLSSLQVERVSYRYKNELCILPPSLIIFNANCLLRFR